MVFTPDPLYYYTHVECEIKDEDEVFTYIEYEDLKLRIPHKIIKWKENDMYIHTEIFNSIVAERIDNE
jgi:hypothetical protein